jgi:hypothetical protein
MTRIARTIGTFCGAGAVCAAALSIRADLVVMHNGDRYNGKVLSVTTNNLVLQSDVLGIVTVPRGKIANVAFGTNVVTIHPPLVLSSPVTNQAALPAKKKAADDISASLRQLGAYTNLIQKVQSQFLAAAGPEANAMFSQMLSDLTTGKMTIADLRAQAKGVADQLRSLQSEAGDDASGTADLYLSILDRFLGETGATSKAGTNSIAPR